MHSTLYYRPSGMLSLGSAGQQSCGCQAARLVQRSRPKTRTFTPVTYALQPGAILLRRSVGPRANKKVNTQLGGSQSREEIFDGCIIPKRAAHVDIPVHIARPQDEAAAKLKRILPQSVLAMASRARAVAGSLVVAPQYMQQIRIVQAGGTVRLALLIDQQRKRDAGFLAEQTRVVSVAESDSRQVGAALAKVLFMFAQLRDVLAAKDSTIVAEEDHHGGLPFP